jgi:BirA family biotin operon repressor/biotin-[acetyl-CoA-carboxylase] ligase
MQWIVTGIGINFTDPGFPEELRDVAGALFTAQPPITRNRLAAEIINRMLDKPCDSKIVPAGYKRRLMMLGSLVTVSGMGEPFEATALDIDGTGRLIVKKGDGEVISLFAGEVSLSKIKVPAKNY